MHEMSLVTGLIDIVRQEMERHGATRLIEVRLKCGALANVVPEALEMAFEIQTEGTPFEGAKLVLEKEPLVLVCGGCGKEFSPEIASPAAVFSTCPHCAEEIGHVITAGRQTYIEHLEVE